jgi:hypothetical protein
MEGLSYQEQWLNSERARELVSPAAQDTFSYQVEAWVQGLHFSEWEAYPMYLTAEATTFVDDVITMGQVRTTEAGSRDELLAAVYNMGLEAMNNQQREQYQDQPIREAIDHLMASPLAREFVIAEEAEVFRDALTGWVMNGLDVNRLEGPLWDEYLDEEAVSFIETETDAGRLRDDGMLGNDRYLSDAIQEVAQIGVEARYALEVQRGTRDDMRDDYEEDLDWDDVESEWEAEEEPERAEPEPVAAAPRSFTDRVQEAVQRVMDVFRGREERSHEMDIGR